MIEKIIIILIITLLVFFVYDFVKNIWTVDICLSYYVRYGNFTYTIPLTDKKTTPWDCYHEALNYMSVYVVIVVFLSLLTGVFISHFNQFTISVEKKAKE